MAIHRYFFHKVLNDFEVKNLISSIFFSNLCFLLRTFTNHRTAVEGEGISLAPH